MERSFKPLDGILIRALSTVVQTESPIEGILLQALIRSDHFTLVPDKEFSGEGLFVLPQYPFGPYRADFYIIARGYLQGVRVWPPRLEKHFIVEADGKDFHSTPEQKEHDARRDQYCRSHGIEVMRFPGSTIYKYADQVAENLARDILHKLRGRE